jgi:hypothetical protein
MKENQTLMSMSTLGPTNDEPCQDCDDDNFIDELGGASSGGRNAKVARDNLIPSDFDKDEWKLHELRQLVRSMLLSLSKK